MDQIQRMVKGAKVTQEAIAIWLGVDHTAFSRMLRGLRRRPPGFDESVKEAVEVLDAANDAADVARRKVLQGKGYADPQTIVPALTFGKVTLVDDEYLASFPHIDRQCIVYREGREIGRLYRDGPGNLSGEARARALSRGWRWFADPALVGWYGPAVDPVGGHRRVRDAQAALVKLHRARPGSAAPQGSAVPAAPVDK